MRIERYSIPTLDGWTLAARRYVPEPELGDTPLVAGQPPVVIVPGYGMNSFIFGYHPEGRSFMQALAESGLDAWAVDLRGQGGSSRGSASRWWGLGDHAFQDLPAVFEFIAETAAFPRIDVIGCSLGGSLVYAYLARYKPGRVRRLVAMGSPLRFVQPSAFIAAVGLFGDIPLAIPIRGTRALARKALPILVQRAPKALSIYLNADITDTTKANELAETVEDPQPGVNLELVRWLRRGRFVIDGMDVAQELVGLDLRVLIVLAMGDGISNPASCRTITPVLGREHVDELVVGGPELQVAHADLFISRISDEQVFQPVARWLLE